MDQKKAHLEIDRVVASQDRFLDLSEFEAESTEEVDELLERICQLGFLEVLRLGGAPISVGAVELPDELFGLENLRGLSLGGTILYLPEAVTRLSRLEVLSLEGFSFEPYPYRIFSMEHLTRLSFMNIPQEHDGRPLAAAEGDLHIGRLTNLDTLGIIDCMIYDLPEEIGQLTNLVDLNLYDCRFLESFPDSFANLSRLKRLDLRNVPIAGRLPKEIKELPGIEILTGREGW